MRESSDSVPQKSFPSFLPTHLSSIGHLYWLFLDLIVPLSLSTKIFFLSLSFNSFASNGSASVPVQEKRGRVFIGKVKLCTSTPSFLVPTSSSSIFLPQFLTFATSHTSPCSITSLSLYLLFLCDYPRALCL